MGDTDDADSDRALELDLNLEITFPGDLRWSTFGVLTGTKRLESCFSGDLKSSSVIVGPGDLLGVLLWDLDGSNTLLASNLSGAGESRDGGGDGDVRGGVMITSTRSSGGLVTCSVLTM